LPIWKNGLEYIREENIKVVKRKSANNEYLNAASLRLVAYKQLIISLIQPQVKNLRQKGFFERNKYSPPSPKLVTPASPKLVLYRSFLIPNFAASIQSTKKFIIHNKTK